VCVSACVYACVSVCVCLCALPRLHHGRNDAVCTVCVCVCICLRKRVCVCLCMCVYVCARSLAYTMDVMMLCVFACVYACACVCVCVCASACALGLSACLHNDHNFATYYAQTVFLISNCRAHANLHMGPNELLRFVCVFAGLHRDQACRGPPRD